MKQLGLRPGKSEAVSRNRTELNQAPGSIEGVRARICVVGSGYVGLTTALVLAHIGHDVDCVDIDPQKINLLNAGEAPFHEPLIRQFLEACAGRISFSTDYVNAVASADVIFIAVGTPNLKTGKPDLGALRSAVREIGRNLGNGLTIVVNKSTAPVGTAKAISGMLQQELSDRNGAGSEVEFAVASNPEFLRQGSAMRDSLYPDRIVIGTEDPRCAVVLEAVYRPIIDQSFAPPEFAPRPEGQNAVPYIVTAPASAEMIKYSANAFLALKISFINEIAEMAEMVGADVTEISAAIGLDPRIGPDFLGAGVGWGGSCFGKDTLALVASGEDLGLDMRITRAARDVNDHQRGRLVDKVEAELGGLDGKRVALLGLAFKPNTDDLRDSPALDLAKRLELKGATVVGYDPAVPEWRLAEEPSLAYAGAAKEALADADAAVLVTDWLEFKALPWKDLGAAMAQPLIFDARNFLDREELENGGFRYHGVGR
ncbi:MAG: UDP-glucose dehydrogenase family protein [Fimbriimonadales bacterium]